MSMIVKLLSEDDVRDYLRHNGISSKSKIDKILNSFDLEKPMYKQILLEGDTLYQFVRRSSFYDLTPGVGSWFCLAGASMQSLAIISGCAGRNVAKFEVRYTFSALEGVAKKQNINWNWSGGGPGGGTQIFVPPRFISALKLIGFNTISSGIANV